MTDDKRADQPMLLGDVRDVLKVADGTIYQLEAAGKLPAQRTPSGVRVWRREVVERLAQQRAQAARAREARVARLRALAAENRAADAS
jgi:predicted site-specific integrase-resolvase